MRAPPAKRSPGCFDVAPEAILPFSTGVILEPLPIDRLTAALPAAVGDLRDDNWFDAAHAIMTTDTVPKGASRRVRIDGQEVTITGISKGAGMIRPNMATMLGFLATDAAIAQPLLERLVREAADASFNSITIDGDTSTNDSFILMATGQAGNADDRRCRVAAFAALREAVIGVSIELAQAIVRDGEGATKFITVAGRNGGAIATNAVLWPTPSPTRRWSRPPSSPPTPTSAASSQRSATPASAISTLTPCASGWATCWSPKRAAVPPATKRTTARASWPRPKST